MEATNPIKTVDARGTHISTHLLYEVVEELTTLKEGDTLELIADDFTALDTDIRSWCGVTGHHLVDSRPIGGGVRYVIRKGDPVPTAHRMAVVVSSHRLEDLLSPLGFAVAAALEDLEVSIFFQGPAVHVLEWGFTPQLKGWRRAFSPFARRKLERIGHDHPHEKLRQLRELGGTIYACGPSLEQFKIAESDLVFEHVIIAEYATFVGEMDGADISIYA
jgi:predicted peroxiredoxin/TusA-related sulfurtransferase